ncbi:hypothetical protein TYRP_018782 [Tyrophagus putrescentiae]|nr:hypothetical protein TYRP_018782 [Tyrophagus putrescentiae]
MNKSQRQTTNINLDRPTSVPSPALNGKKKNDRLTFVDFSPQTNSSYVKSLFSKTETYSVLKRASQTIRQRTDPIRLLSCSTLCCPTNALATSQAGAKFVDTNKTFYSNAEWCNSGGFLAKFVRIAIAKTTEGSGSSAPNPLLNCKIFVPVKKNGSEPSSPDHEMQTLKDAVQSWFAKTEAKVLSVETETISSAITWTSSTTLIDTCLSLNKFPCDQLIVFKVYIDGHYVEPSKEPKHAKASN